MTTPTNTPTDTAKPDTDGLSPKCERVQKAFRILKEVVETGTVEDTKSAVLLLTYLQGVFADMEEALIQIADLHEDDMDYCTEVGPNRAMATVTLAEDALGITRC